MSAFEEERFTPILAALQADAPKYFGVPGVTFRPVSIESRRSSILMRVEVDDQQAPYQAFLKVYRASADPANRAKVQQRVVREFEVTRRVHDALADDPHLGAVRPIAAFPEQLAIMTKRAAGLSVGHLIGQTMKWRATSGLESLEQVMSNVGRWVRQFQDLDTTTYAGQTLEGLLTYVDARLDKLRAHDAISKEDAASVLARLEMLWAGLAPEDLQTRVMHADYCLGNVLVDGQRVVVLDFAMTRQGARFHDLSHMHMQVRLMGLKPWFHGRSIETLGRALLQGYGGDAAEDHPLFEALTVLHVVNHLTKLTIRPAKSAIARPYGWYVRRALVEWLREHGCFASGRVA